MCHHCQTDIMTYDEYIAQEQQAMDEEQRDDSCFLVPKNAFGGVTF
jgi:hypothetical protein